MIQYEEALCRRQLPGSRGDGSLLGGPADTSTPLSGASEGVLKRNDQLGVSGNKTLQPQSQDSPRQCQSGHVALAL